MFHSLVYNTTLKSNTPVPLSQVVHHSYPTFKASRRARYRINDPAVRTPVHKHIHEYGLSTNVHVCTSLLPWPSLACQCYIHPGSKYRLLAIRLMNANMQFAVFRFLDLRAVYPQMLPGRSVKSASAFFSLSAIRQKCEEEKWLIPLMIFLGVRAEYICISCSFCILVLLDNKPVANVLRMPSNYCRAERRRGLRNLD